MGESRTTFSATLPKRACATPRLLRALALVGEDRASRNNDDVGLRRGVE